ncbi:SusC/RagA family TonB-linked outer membrane protein [Zunongwangia sp.]|uniref:SusC/RagA family TonB-linked outer membrane protein n=1 Tax=Zunongwangia sp. TaxID=1965325 RepID=UPI003AA9CEF5
MYKNNIFLIYSFAFILFLSQVNVYGAENDFFSLNKNEQGIIVTGKVIGAEDGMPLPGVTIMEKGTNNGTATDFDGNYTLTVSGNNSVLTYSYVGFKTKEIKVGEDRYIDISLETNVGALEETVIIGFGGKQKKASLVSSITSVSPSEIKGPTNNLTSMMAGRVPGMISYQRSGEPGADNSDFFIRGLGTFGTGKRNPLILIDGIESTTTDMARLQPDDISSFSVLKDAAAASVYGARGANGVVLITTKTGKAGKTKFSFRSETRISSNTDNFDFADNITYMNLANEAALTRDRNAVLPYTQTKIDRTAAGDNPLLYPSNNWIDQLIKDYTINESLNLSASGGSEKARYYISGTYTVDNGVLDVEGINNFNSNIKLRNYSLRSNVNLQLTPTTKARVNIYGQFDDFNGPVGGGKGIFNKAVWSNPVAFPAIYPADYLPYIEHPLFGGAPTGLASETLLTNPYAEMVRGYQTKKSSTIQAQVELQQDLSFITEGLRIRSMGYIRRYSYYDVSRQYNPFFYKSSINPIDGSIQLSVLNDGSETSIGTVGTEYLNYSEGDKKLDSRIYNETAINYDRVFNEKHAVSGMLLNLISSYETGNAGSVQNSLANRNHGISGRFTYGYDNRYLAEFNFGYNGSERFAKGHRYGFFPSGGLGYRISNEQFFEPLKNVISNLKFRVTYGLVGNDQIGNTDERFFYLSNVNLNDGNYGATFGQDFGYYRPGVYISRYPNANIGWEESEQINLGMDLELFNSLNFVVDVFRQKRTNILQTRSEIGSAIGLTATPQTNFAAMQSEGLDFSMDYSKQLNSDWWTQLRANLTYATNEVLEYDEVDYPEELAYRSRIGDNASQVYGYIAERLFVDQEEVNNSPTQFGDYTGGDIKYRDVNGDGVISQSDMVPIGLPTVPEIIYGFGGSVGYKNWDFSAFFQGSARSSFFIDPENISPFVINGGAQNGLLNVIAEDYWSEDNRDAYAFWPRLSQTFVENNTLKRDDGKKDTSTWWMRSGDFLRLKTMELGFSPKGKLLDKLHLNSLRIYASGLNLAVWSDFDLWDPEMGGDGLGYPIQSVYNVGLQLTF